MRTTAARGIVVSLVVFALWAVALSLSQLLLTLVRLPQSVGFSVYVRLIGLLVVLCSLLLFGWLLKYRTPVDILNSTYVTFSKIITGTRLDEKSGRTEPLVVVGPYRFVRHPLYSAVLLLGAGLWLILDYTPLLMTTLLLLLWFSFVVAPFEERELKAIFGVAYSEYARTVPRFVPMRFSHRKTASD